MSEICGINLFGHNFLHSSVSKKSACNAGDPGLIPGSEGSPGEGIGYPLQCSWASLVAQLVKNPEDPTLYLVILSLWFPFNPEQTLRLFSV